MVLGSYANPQTYTNANTLSDGFSMRCGYELNLNGTTLNVKFWNMSSASNYSWLGQKNPSIAVYCNKSDQAAVKRTTIYSQAKIPTGGTNSWYGNKSCEFNVETADWGNSYTIFLEWDQSGVRTTSGQPRGFTYVFGGTWKKFIDVNLYTPASITLNSVSPTIGKLGITEYNMNYTITEGNTGIDWSAAVLFNWNITEQYWATSYDKSSGGTYDDKFKLPTDEEFVNGGRYKVKARCSDNHNEHTSDSKDIYTYQKPTINTSLTIDKTTQNANTSNKFTISGTNNRAWSDYESEFQTRYRIKRGSAAYTDWSNLGNITSWSRTASQMRSLVSKSYDGKDITMQFKRYSPSSEWYSDDTAQNTFKIYYRPRAGVTSTNTSYKRNNSSGGSVSKGQYIKNDSSLTGIYVSWTYDTTSADAGYTQGYRIRLYNAAGTVVKTYYTSNKNYTIPKADIPRIQLTKIDITPYFKNDSTDSSQYWYYNGTIEKSNFVILSSDLAKPVITYPIANSNWINKDFRVCFQLPTDPDKGSESETYHYEDIEIQINSNYTIRMKDSYGRTTTGTTVASNNGPYSALQANLTYQRKMVLYPNALGSMPTASNNTYNIRVRVKKKYGASSSLTMWSPWSDTRTIKVTGASFAPNVGDKILASHYNNMKSVVDRVRKTYSVTWSNIPGNVTAGSTMIKRTQYPYANLYDRIVATKNQVNNYATFDVAKAKFDSSNAILTNFTAVVEIVTAASNETNSPNGRDYIRIIYDRCNRLK